MPKRTLSIKLALLITLVMAIALGYLYLLERKKIYTNIKQSSINLIQQEKQFHEQLGQEWDKNLTDLMNHNNMRLYLSAYDKNPAEIPEIYKTTLAKLFVDITSYKSNYIQRVSLIDANGDELIAAENGKVATTLISWYDSDYFRNSINRTPNKLLGTSFEHKADKAYMYMAVPVVAGNSKPVLLMFTIRFSDLLQKYQYLLIANLDDIVMAATLHASPIFQLGKGQVGEEELSKVFSSIKQQNSGAPIVEYGQNVWSYLENEQQGYYILFQSRGQKITRVLNEEYIKICGVFFASSFILVLLVYFSTRRMQRQVLKLESEKAIHSQRSHNFASISDEIRRPLNALMGSLVTLEENDEQLKGNTYLNSARKIAVQLTELINEFTDFAKISKGEFSLQEIEFDLRTTLNDIADIMTVQAEEKGLEISCLVSSNMPARVKGDATRLRQILINLISFAIKYTHKGEISLGLSIEDGTSDKKLIHIDVSDTGNVIDQGSMLEHFNMFTDPTYYSNDEYVGEGLPLALSSELIKLMDGVISVKENNAGGNTFRVSLPMPVVEPVFATVPQDNLKGKRVLIIGEIETNRQMLSAALSRWGMAGGTMSEFKYVNKVLSEAQTSGKAYDACVIDISLTSMSDKAFELVKTIRTEFDEFSLGIVILTVQGAPGDAQIAREIGAQAFLTKPLTREGMKEVLLRIFDRKPERPAEFVTRYTIKEVAQEKLMHILVADSGVESWKNIANLFDTNQVKLDFAQDGSALEDAINNGVYNLVLIELDLPGIDSQGFVKKFRSEEASSNKAFSASGSNQIRLPIIAITQNVNTDLFRRCEENGFDDLLPKPLNQERVNYLLESITK